jgi:hypothetical protein
MTQTPNPFDPVEEAQIASMVNEGGRDKPSTDLDNAVQTDLDAFQRLGKGESAPSVVVKTDGNHASASWEKPSQKKT